MRVHQANLADVLPFVRPWESLPPAEREFVATRLSYPERYDGILDDRAIDLLRKTGFLERSKAPTKRPRMDFSVSEFRGFIRMIWKYPFFDGDCLNDPQVTLRAYLDECFTGEEVARLGFGAMSKVHTSGKQPPF
jgi:hypothetical protein